MSGTRSKLPRPTLLDRTGIHGTSMLHRLGGRAEIPAPVPETEQAAPPAFPSGSRRLSDLPPATSSARWKAASIICAGSGT